MNLRDYLDSKGIVSIDQFDEFCSRHSCIPAKAGIKMVQKKLLSAKQLAEAFAHLADCPLVSEIKADPDLCRKLPKNFMPERLVLPVKQKTNTVTVVMADPMDFETVHEMEFIFDCKVARQTVALDVITSAIESFINEDEYIFNVLKEISADADIEVLTAVSDKDAAMDSTLSRSGSHPLIRFVNLIIHDAMKMNASDIHIEPGKNIVELRYRIDGLMKSIMKIPSYLHNAIVGRIKIISSLDIAEHRVPQDGHAKLKINDQERDLRVSTVPTIFGEKVVIRIMTSQSNILPVDDIGFSGQDAATIKKMLSNPQGLILVTGPTGSGKSSTLYSFLEHIKSEVSNIVSVEDPVEFQ